MRGNSFSNGPGSSMGNSSYNGQGPAAINPYTGRRLQPDHWWYLV